jgi:hypothetical protein
MSLPAHSREAAPVRTGPARSRRLWQSLLRPGPLTSSGQAAPPTGSGASREPLLSYLNDLEAWSHRVWTAAGLSRSWLPYVMRRELRHQWWAAPVVPPAPALRERIVSFWMDVTPWLAWNPSTEPLPPPPPDDLLIEEMWRGIQRELERSGSSLLGEERSTALWGAGMRLERLTSVARSLVS